MNYLYEYLENIYKKLTNIAIQARKHFSDEFFYIINRLDDNQLKIKTIKEHQK